MIAEMYMLRYARQSGALFFDSVVFVECFYDRLLFRGTRNIANFCWQKFLGVFLPVCKYLERRTSPVIFPFTVTDSSDKTCIKRAEPMRYDDIYVDRINVVE